MECLNEVFPVLLYILLIVLVVCIIIFVVKAIKTLGKVDKVVEDVNNKVNKLDGVFNVIDSTADTMSLVSDKLINFVFTAITNLFRKKDKREDEIDE